MTTESTYNGWTNYETWNVALWIENDAHSYEYWRLTTQEHLDDCEGDKDEAARTLSEALRNDIDEQNPLAESASMFSDLLGAALSEVNWHEIATNWLDDCEYVSDDDE